MNAAEMQRWLDHSSQRDTSRRVREHGGKLMLRSEQFSAPIARSGKDGSLLSLGLQLAVFVLLNDLLAVSEPARHSPVGFAVRPLGLENFLSLLIPVQALA